MKDVLDSKITTMMNDDVLCVDLKTPIGEVVHVMMTNQIHGVGVWWTIRETVAAS